MNLVSLIERVKTDIYTPCGIKTKDEGGRMKDEIHPSSPILQPSDEIHIDPNEEME